MHGFRYFTPLNRWGAVPHTILTASFSCNKDYMGHVWCAVKAMYAYFLCIPYYTNGLVLFD